MDDASVVDNLSGIIVGDRYTIEKEIGRGGMAIVWLAHDARHSRKVAIKTLHPDLASAIGVDRFLRELRLTARLQHPRIVPILDSGAITRPDGTSMPWYAMPYLHGESLRERLKREQQLSIEESLRITEAIGEALAAAHHEQIIHRDIKPENVFLAGDQVYVVDFGIAKALDTSESEHLTSTGLTIGTPAYMSPEQSLGGPVDARTDQYSLATILYEMLAGEPPFTGPNQQFVFARRLSEPASSISSVRSTVPRNVEAATLKALERTPADRFPSVDAFVTALRRPEVPGPAPLTKRAPRLVPAVLGVALLAIVAVAGWSLSSRARPAKPSFEDPQVVSLYRRGVRAYDRRTPEGAVEAIATLREAVAQDSTYVPAWTALAKTYARAYGRTFQIPGISADRLLTLGVEAADRALELDSMSAAAWLTQGILRQQIEPTDYAPALAAVLRSIELDSTQAPAWYYWGTYHADIGDFKTALPAWRRSVRLDPAYAEGLAFLALGYYWRRNYDSAAFWADSAIRVSPNYILARSTAGFIAIERADFTRAEAAFGASERASTEVEAVNAIAGLALVKAREGHRSEAKAIADRADSLAKKYQPIPLHTAIYLAQDYAALGDADHAMRLLASFEPARHLHFQLHLRCDPPFDLLSKDERFRRLLIAPSPPPGKGC